MNYFTQFDLHVIEYKWHLRMARALRQIGMWPVSRCV